MRDFNVSLLLSGVDTSVSHPLCCVPAPGVESARVKWPGVGPVSEDHMYAARNDAAWLTRGGTFNVAQFERCSRAHPDRELVTLILKSMWRGFHVGYTGDRSGMDPVPNRIKQADVHKASVKILEEVQAGRFAGPFPSPPYAQMRFSPLQAVPKDGDDIRLLINLSSPFGDSVNTYEHQHAMRYEGVDMVCGMIASMGPTCRLWKLDVKSAYRHVRVHPSDYHLLGFTWLGMYFFDTRCSFGARHSAYDWEYVGALLKWILVHHFNVGLMARWVDDYIGISAADTAHECYTKARAACAMLQVPVHKREAPTTSLSYCGVTFDTPSMRMSVPDAKSKAVLALLDKWKTRLSCKKTDLQSLVGKLHHLAKPTRSWRRVRLALVCSGVVRCDTGTRSTRGA